MPLAEIAELVRVARLLQGELADSFQHAEPGFARLSRVSQEQAVGKQRLEPGNDRA